jgi:hypothetical protein
MLRPRWDEVFYFSGHRRSCVILPHLHPAGLGDALPYGSTMIRIHLYECVVLGRDTRGHQIKRQKEPAPPKKEPRRGTGPKEFRRGRLESSDSILTYRSGIGDHGEAWRFVKRTHGSHLIETSVYKRDHEREADQTENDSSDRHFPIVPASLLRVCQSKGSVCKLGGMD